MSLENMAQKEDEQESKQEAKCKRSYRKIHQKQNHN